MEQIYDITKNGQAVGTAAVEKDGLYYRFTCRCRGSGIFHLRVSRGGKEESLGIPVPEGGEYRLRTRIPVSRFPAGEFRFFVEEPKKETFVPVIPGQPFPYLSKLKNARYALRNGTAGVILSDVQDDAHGTVI